MPAVPTTPRVKLRATSRRVPRARAASGDKEPETDPEPNMRLSRAILVMLLLHVVAVGGILAFSLVKEHNADQRTRDGGGSTAAGALEADDSLVPTTKPIPPADASAPGGKGSVHVVQPGETLLRIANENGVTVDALIAVNGARTATSSLRPGQALKLPEKSPDPAANTAADHAAALGEATHDDPSPGLGGSPAPGTAKAARLPSDPGKTYTVGKGESPYTIAQKLKVSYDALIRLNHIDDPKKLKPGQKLLIPPMAKGKTKEN